MEEIWKDIVNHPGYQVSDKGRIRTLDRLVKSKNNSYRSVKGQIIKPYLTSFGYLRANLWENQHYKTYFIHRLVWETFKGPVPKGMQVNHINEDKTDNRLENLNLLTPQENCNWGTHNEKIKQSRIGFKMPKSSIATLKKKIRKPIIQMDLAGNEIVGWLSATDCEKVTGYDQGLLSCVCRGKYKQAYGYKWKYA